uniref:Uncharacterized protein n=1 Tax=Oncorhynchus tshawytscha TaxID=74940 RepID=A0AAZ3SIY9_ONCTS
MRRRPSETASTSGTLAVRDCIKCLFSRNQYSIQSPSSNGRWWLVHSRSLRCGRFLRPLWTSRGPWRTPFVPYWIRDLERGAFSTSWTGWGMVRRRDAGFRWKMCCILLCCEISTVSIRIALRLALRVVPEMHTPANTPATPPNFPDALTMFSRLKASESFNASSPIASMATSPPQVNWAMGPSAPGQTQQGLWTSGQMPSQVPPPGWPQAVTQQASSEQASVTMEAER